MLVITKFDVLVSTHISNTRLYNTSIKFFVKIFLIFQSFFNILGSTKNLGILIFFFAKDVIYYSFFVNFIKYLTFLKNFLINYT